MIGVEVVGHWMPAASAWYGNNADVCRTVQIHLKAVLARSGYECARPEGEPQVRPPGTNYNNTGDISTEWHQDGDVDRVILWASHNPTWFRPLPDSDLPRHYQKKLQEWRWEARPGDLVLVHNKLVLHRHPDKIHPRRIFARFWNVNRMNEEKKEGTK